MEELEKSRLSVEDRQVVQFVEYYYLLHGLMPDIECISIGCVIPQSVIKQIMQKKEVQTALDNRGVVYAAPGTRLSGTQLKVANAMLDFTDNRSEKKKLDDLGVSTKQYQGWLRNQVFSDYLRNRAESLLSDTMHVAHTSLVDSVRAGDVQALKLYYEITGRHSSKTVGDMNVQYFMVKVLEAIQKHVHDPIVLQNIAAEFDVISQPKEIAS